MTIKTVTADQLELLAFESGATIHIGAHEADVTIGDVHYVARLGGAA